tara:strand:- start:616 stop:840 length:225 start_codon:yes stop_codon:yes gene_type:complete
MPFFIVEKIEFDFDDATDEQISQEEKDFITNNALGVWSVDEEDELVDKISDKTGWCIKSIDYTNNRPHPLTSFK